MSETDDIGREVILYGDTYEKHVRPRHPEAVLDLDHVRSTIAQPNGVYYGDTSDREVFQEYISTYSSFQCLESLKKLYMTVPVKIPEEPASPKVVLTFFWSSSWERKPTRRKKR